MEIVLNRQGGVPIKDQLRFQLELKILVGEWGPGERLPSVRALARRLRLHPNTVSAAYRDLEATGHVDLQRGAGVFVKPGAPSTPQEARNLDEMIRLALYLAFRRGFSGNEIRAAVERWLAAAPPDRVVVVDASKETGELLVHELKQAFQIDLSSCTLDELERNPALLSGALALTLPYHLQAVARLAPAAAVESVVVEITDDDRQAVLSLPDGAIVLFVSHSPMVLPFARVVLESLRGSSILTETRLLSETREWRRMLPAADLVFTDALAAETVHRWRPLRIRQIRILSQTCLDRLREALSVVLPHDAKTVSGEARRSPVTGASVKRRAS